MDTTASAPSRSRRQVIAGTAGIAARPSPASATAARADTTDTTLGGIHAIPELAPQWKKLDLAEICRGRPPMSRSASEQPL